MSKNNFSRLNCEKSLCTTKNSFQISISDRFFQVSGVQKLDSANLYSYISQLETVQAEKFVENPDELREKLRASSPFCSIQIEDSDKSRNKTVEIYPGQTGIYGWLRESDEIVLFEQKVIENVMVSKQLFVRRN